MVSIFTNARQSKHTYSESMKTYRKKIKNNFQIVVAFWVKERGKELKKNLHNHRAL